jgi:putative heme-binding domain-containing protein
LYQRQDLSAGPILAEMVNSSPFPLGRIGALYALDGLGALGERLVLKALKDTDARVREAGVELCERILKDGNVSDAVWGQLGAMTSDPSVRVRYQLAFTLGEINRSERVVFLSRLLLQNMTNMWMRGAVASSLVPGAGEMVSLLGRTPQVRNTAAGVALMSQLSTMIGCSGRMDEVGQVLDFALRYVTDEFSTFGVLAGLGDGLLRTRSSLALVDPNGQLQPLYDAAVTDALAPGASEPLRLSAIRFLGVSPYTYTNIGLWVLALLDSGSSEAVKSAVLVTLGQWDDPIIATNVLLRWQGFTPALRTQALTALLNRDSRIDTVLAALERGVISDADFSTVQKNFLRTYHYPAVRERAVAAFGPVPVTRPDVVGKYRGALELRGIGSQGRGIFLERCAACHRYGGEGKRVGPDLDGARVSGKERILSRILEPNAEVRPDYQTYVLGTRTDQNFVGLIREDNPSALTFVQPEGVELIWPKAGVAGTQAQTWSLMPDGLEKGLTTQGMADLLEYLVRGAGTP